MGNAMGRAGAVVVFGLGVFSHGRDTPRTPPARRRTLTERPPEGLAPGIREPPQDVVGLCGLETS